MSGTQLYRIYDERVRLLYVGISDNALYRTQTHSLRSPWWPMAATWSVEDIGDRGAAERAEFEAVRDEGPLYNTNYNEWFKGSASDARRAIPTRLERRPVAWEASARLPLPPPYRIRRWKWGGRIESLPFTRAKAIAGTLVAAHPHLAEEEGGVPSPWGHHAVVAHAVLTSLATLDSDLLTHDEVYAERPTSSEEMST